MSLSFHDFSSEQTDVQSRVISSTRCCSCNIEDALRGKSMSKTKNANHHARSRDKGGGYCVAVAEIAGTDSTHESRVFEGDSRNSISV